jgi:phosphotransferase system HPr (HPr) family protein
VPSTPQDALCHCLEPETQAPVTRAVVVADPDGLHLRRCMAVIHALRRHRARVTIRVSDQMEDASSILGLMSLAAPHGTELILSATGPTANEALEAVAELLASDALASC